ncbi:5'/3'-nucleotidase SurE [Dactylosporangium sp. CA-233914]|uniref:5'/3'-nucleotidase SurE n=1 Tax=Dactylosporangium sp. CA-233914 TaxID=3239934 RepID=UPI003D92F9E0
MRVLITNDDGIDAPGLRALARAAAEAGHEVTVAAPHREASGSGAALNAVTASGRLVLSRVELDGGPAFAAAGQAFSVAASPAYIAVLAALGVFGPAPDILLSGINRGANAGHAILHSGTVGAALTAATEGLRALAVSLDVLTALPGADALFRERDGSGGALAREPSAGVLPREGSAGVLLRGREDGAGREALHWATAGELAMDLLSWLAEAPPATVLNLNVPNRPRPAVRGVRRAVPAPFGQVRMSVAEAARDYARITVVVREETPPPDTDLALLTAGYATLTALRPPADDPDLDLPVD